MTATACSQPGCTGTILDGYCDVCGSPAGASDFPAEATPVGSVVGTGSARLASAPIGSLRAAASGSKITRRLGTSSSRLRGARLGAGLTTVPPVPVTDPLAAIMKHPQVPEDRRFCPSCQAPVGRSRDGHPGRTEGFCPKCRAPFSFAPKLAAGDMVAGQYEVAGCLAHGGMGWIYLARDRNVSDRWVVLKGLLNSGDPDALAAAIAERQFLAQVAHPLIVEIYNFVSHEGAGYIVMEYVGGVSLKSILKDRMAAKGGVYDPIPVDQAIAYLVEVLPAFGYLHDLGLLYCDFKPDNIIQVGDAVKLIDLGGVRRADDVDSAIYGTVGYQAPEVPEVGPSVASDIYTIGRTLAVLVTEFRGYQSRYVASLPPPSEVPLFREQDSLYRLLVKACAADPGDRFATADELRVQLLGVLREVVAERSAPGGAATHSTPSLLFLAPTATGDEIDWQHLPALRVDEHDPMAPWLATVSVAAPDARLDVLAKAPSASLETRLAVARAAIEAGRIGLADTSIAEVLAEDPWEWRAMWLSGLSCLSRDDVEGARAAFNAVYGQVPGELAPKLALAVACERSGATDVAESLYTVCVRTDANYVAVAAFGLARIRRARNDLKGAITALDLVPPTSGAFPQARWQRAGLLAGSGGGLPALAAALESISAVPVEPLARARLTLDVLEGALREVLAGRRDRRVTILGKPAEERPLRDGLETAYREAAELVADRTERIRLVDSANRIRRWTLV
ncbi:MAG: protein kinase [Actinomycetales bacterium]|nr:protein kinase [Actinomycetales bacterium]